MFVEDAAKKKAIADVYLANARGYLSGPAPEYPDGDTRGERMGRVRDSATYLAEHMHRPRPAGWGGRHQGMSRKSMSLSVFRALHKGAAGGTAAAT